MRLQIGMSKAQVYGEPRSAGRNARIARSQMGNTCPYESWFFNFADATLTLHWCHTETTRNHDMPDYLIFKGPRIWQSRTLADRKNHTHTQHALKDMRKHADPTDLCDWPWKYAKYTLNKSQLSTTCVNFPQHVTTLIIFLITRSSAFFGSQNYATRCS